MCVNMKIKHIGGFAKLHLDDSETSKLTSSQLIRVPIGGFAFVEARRGTRISGVNEKAALREKEPYHKIPC